MTSRRPHIDALEPRMTMLEIALSTVQDTLKRLEEIMDSLKREYVDFTVTTKTLI